MSISFSVEGITTDQVILSVPQWLVQKPRLNIPDGLAIL
jgi:hypothetical protein